MDWTPASNVDEDLSESTASSFLKFLLVAQALQLDFLPITWHRGMQSLGEGATTQVNQSIVSAQQFFAFKLRPHQTRKTEKELLSALCTEARILRHPPVQTDENIVSVLGCIWEVDVLGDIAWPVLVFPKATYGSFQAFLSTVQGQETALSTKLKLCGNVVSGIQTLHGCNIVHGDLKPENILVFDSVHEIYIAKLTDFGYSCFSEDDSILLQLPQSEPWAGPEWHHRGFVIKYAKLFDMFSLGMVYLWTMLEHLRQSNILTDTVLTLINNSPYPCLDQSTVGFLRQAKQRRTLPELALSTLKALSDLSQSQKDRLSSLLDRALQHDHDKRKINIDHFVRGVTFSEQVEPENTKIGLCPKSLIHSPFRLANMVCQLSLVGYQVRHRIARCLETVSRSWKEENINFCCETCSHNVSFQLALALLIGLAGFQDNASSCRWLNWSSRSSEDLKEELSALQKGSIKLEYTGQFERLKQEGLIHLSDLAELSSYTLSENSVETCCIREIEAATVAFGSSHFITVMLKQSLSSIYTRRSAYTKALHLEIECFEAIQKFEEKNVRIESKAKLRLAAKYSQLGKFSTAMNLQIDALSSLTDLYGDEHPTTISAAAELACTLHENGDWDQAKSEFQRLSEKSERIFGECHPETMSLKANLAMALKKLEIRGEALEQENKVLKQCMQTLGSDHSMTWKLVSNLAQSYIFDDDPNKAEDLFRFLAIPQREEQWSQMSPMKLRILNQLALVYFLQKKLSTARLILERSLQFQRVLLGPDHVDVAETFLTFARVVHAEGNLHESISVIEDLYQRHIVTRSNFADSSLDVFREEMVRFCTILGMQDKTIAIQRQLVSTRRYLLGVNHIITLEATVRLYETLKEQGEYVESDELETSFTKGQLENVKHVTVAVQVLTPLIRASSILIDRGDQLDQAQRVLESVYPTACRVLGPTHPVAVYALGNLASTYALRGADQNAFDTYIKLIKIKIQTFGRDSESTQITMNNFRHFARIQGAEPELLEHILAKIV